MKAKKNSRVEKIKLLNDLKAGRKKLSDLKKTDRRMIAVFLDEYGYLTDKNETVFKGGFYKIHISEYEKAEKKKLFRIEIEKKEPIKRTIVQFQNARQKH